MAIREIRVFGYRSVRDLRLPLTRVNILTGANGCGKSNLYQSLVLLARAARGEFARAMAEEGGLPSVFWAGPERIRYQRKKPPKRVVLGFEGDDYGFELQAGLPPMNSLAIGTKFQLDPEVKEEAIWPGGSKRQSLLLNRQGPTAWVRDRDGAVIEYPLAIRKEEAVISQVIEPHLYPEISAIRQQMLGWRFYHHFRTDLGSPLRAAQIGVHTPAMSASGEDVAAALQTIIEVGDDAALQQTIGAAFQGATLEIQVESARFAMALRLPGLLRPLEAREFSDGQLRFLCLCAALLSTQPPPLLALNEPETSLHPDLIEPLAALIVRASKYTQLWITTHSRELADRIEGQSGVPRIALESREGETCVSGSSRKRYVFD